MERQTDSGSIVTSTDLNQSLHVVSGYSAAGLLRQALRFDRDRILVTEDPLSIGLAPATDDLELWRSTREPFLKSLHNSNDPPPEEYNPKGLNTDLLSRERSIVVWAGIGLPEQLLLARVVVLFEQLALDPSRLSVVQFEASTRWHPVRAILTLNPEELREHPEPRTLLPAELQELGRAWHAYTSDKPADLAEYVATPGPMPILHRAMRCLIQRYPDHQSGTSSWDERLLHYTMERGPKAARVLAHTMTHDDDPDLVGDAYLFHRLMRLADPNLASPLVSVEGSKRTLRECRVTLTPFGQKVLAGDASQVRENGIDDWIGGVHLTSAGPVTFREGDTLGLPA
jgi:hypothetical protein